MSATLPDRVDESGLEHDRPAPRGSRPAAGMPLAEADGMRFAAQDTAATRADHLPRMLAGRDPGAPVPAAPGEAGAGVVGAGEAGAGAPERSPRERMAATIGGRIRALRRARGLTQDTLAVSTGVSRSAVAQWETGRAGQMSGKLRRIAEALGVSVSMLRDGWEGLATDSVLSTEEMSLLRLFRLCSVEDRAVLMHVAQKLSEPTLGD